jgi:hypothetical protein
LRTRHADGDAIEVFIFEKVSLLNIDAINAPGRGEQYAEE